MTFCGIMKLPAKVDKPPLFNSGYRSGGSEPNKPVNVNSLPGLPHVSGSVALGAPVNDFKVPKQENELSFSSDLDSPSFKRPKFADENHQPQIHLLQRRDLPPVPLFSNHRSPPIVEHEGDLVRDEDVPSTTGAESINIESHFNPLNEPSPLGLNLRKSPSLLDLIQRKLAQNDDDSSERLDQGGNLSRLGSFTSSADKDKLKAANFPASKLRIGEWEGTSRYDGDLVAKCYYAKRKLVWEVLDSGLKSKMEVQWSDISALKASFPDDQPAVLDIELSRPPLFFREINPQPRKHTIWQSTSDFTDGKATICRHHSVQFPVGVLNRHFDKLLQCDVRLKALSEQTRSIQDSYFFDNRSMPIDRQHMLNYQSVLSDRTALQPLAIGGMNDEALLPAIRAVDCSQSHVPVQGFQNEPLQHLSPHHGTVETMNSVRLEGLRSEPLQRTTSVLTEVSPGAGVRHRQGGFHLQFATVASPSSVIDTRVLNESSSSSETEEAPPKDIGRSEAHNEPLNLHISQESCRQFSPVKSGPIRQLNEWTYLRSQDGSMAWSVDSAVLSTMNHVSEKQVLNELSLHLLGEPISSTDPRQFSLGRASGRAIHEMLKSTGSSNVPQSAYHKDFVHKLDKNLGTLHQGHLSMGEPRMFRDSQWNVALDHRALEAGPSSLASHGSYVDLVYLPRIASQPQFLEPGP